MRFVFHVVRPLPNVVRLLTSNLGLIYGASICVADTNSFVTSHEYLHQSMLPVTLQFICYVAVLCQVRFIGSFVFIKILASLSQRMSLDISFVVVFVPPPSTLVMISSGFVSLQFGLLHETHIVVDYDSSL